VTAPAQPQPTGPAPPRPASRARHSATPRTAPALLSPRIVAATARRVLLQLRADRRTVAMLLVVPSVLLTLIHEMFDSQPAFNRIALTLLGIFPFTLMFLVTSIAMLRERTGGTLERLLTTPLSKLDLLLGYGIAFAVAATVQASVTCLTAYLLLDMYTPGHPLLVLAVAIAGAALGMAIGLLASAFATSEFQAVQFMPVVVLPQVFLGGLFVPREQMADWLEAISDGLPLTYAIDALEEVGRTSLVTADFLRDIAVVVGVAVLALVLAATTLRRRTGDPTPGQRRRRRLVPLTAAVIGAGLALGHAVETGRYVTTEDAAVDGQQAAVVAPVAGTLVAWRATQGTTVHADEALGRLEMSGPVRPRMVLRAPTAGTVVLDSGVEGSYVTAGTRLAVVYDLAQVYVTARVDEDELAGVHLGASVEVRVDADPDRVLTGVVLQVANGTTATLTGPAPETETAVYDRSVQVVPVRIGITDRRGLLLAPGMNATVKIHKS